MDTAERRDRIVEYLRIKPISHGQVYTFQIAIPESEAIEIPFERRENLQTSLTQQGSNLIPLIVRRTEAYSEEEEYEVVYGADWCLVAKELDIEKLWVWVFDMTDEQAAAAKEEMQQLLGSSDSSPVVVQPPSEETESIKPILQKLDKSFQQLETLNKKNVETLTQKIEQVAASVKKLEESESKQTTTQDNPESLADKVEQIVEAVKRIESFISKSSQVEPGRLVTETNKINLNSIKTAKELERYKIPQLGPKRAEAIVRLREQKGKLQSLAELMEVKGMTPTMIKIFDAYLFCD